MTVLDLFSDATWLKTLHSGYSKAVVSEKPKLAYNIDRRKLELLGKRSFVEFPRKVQSEKITYVRIWNCGKNPFAGSKFSKSFRIIFRGGEVHKAHIHRSTLGNSAHIDAKEDRDSNEVEITFDYLAYNKGVVIKIVHDKNTQVVGIEGYIKGEKVVAVMHCLPKIAFNRVMHRKIINKLAHGYTWFAIIAGLACFLFLAYFAEVAKIATSEWWKVTGQAMLIYALLCAMGLLCKRIENEACPDDLFYC